MTAAEDRCLWTLDRIDPYLEGDLDSEEIAKVENHLADCEDCREELALARAVVQELRALPALECPPGVVERAAALGTSNHESAIHRLLGWFGGRNVFNLRPAMAVMVLVIAAVSVFVLSQHEQSPFHKEPKYTEQEIELATVDAMLAFAYLGKFSKRTGEILKNDVINDRVIIPLGKTVTEPIYPFRRHD
jgi:anti-sigma factor RsiW